MEIVNEKINLSYDSKIYQLADDAVWPTSTSQEIPAGSILLGDSTTDGEAFSRSVSEETRKAHQKGKVVRRFVTDAPKTLSASFLETNKDVLALYHGAPVVDGHVTSGNKVITANFVYDTFDEEYGAAVRYVFRASVTPNGDIAYVDTELSVYPLLFTVIGDVEIYFSHLEPVVPAP